VDVDAVWLVLDLFLNSCFLKMHPSLSMRW